jgi:hypothetical protein
MSVGGIETSFETRKKSEAQKMMVVKNAQDNIMQRIEFAPFLHQKRDEPETEDEWEVNEVPSMLEEFFYILYVRFIVCVYLCLFIYVISLCYLFIFVRLFVTYLFIYCLSLKPCMLC